MAKDPEAAAYKKLLDYFKYWLWVEKLAVDSLRDAIKHKREADIAQFREDLVYVSAIAAARHRRAQRYAQRHWGQHQAASLISGHGSSR
ncbi:hypothetical protein ACG02S_07955 [Roseateles sp. DC23W]|uniref:Uncharacterized protein n=1 Tax=Pelomonas dachongensis TaxID=3299029 RepID=A0ABW7EK39_9BURK